MVYGLETVVVTKKTVEEMKVVEIKMLRFAVGVTKKEKMRNEYIRGTVNTRKMENSPYLERRLRSILTASVFRAKIYLIVTKLF